MTLRVGTRGSALATAQAGDVARSITERTGIPTELVLVTTHGDISRESLSSLGGTGVFASALREALIAGECDLVVHSMKDLPTAPYAGLTVAAVPERADARDVLCARDGLTFAELPVGARVGTGSPRRVAQVLAARPDLELVDIRGNLDTRLAFVTDGHVDAVILAAAGLGRLGRNEHITDHFPLDAWPTAPAQGALAVEIREGDENGDGDVAQAIAAIVDEEAAAVAIAERQVLARLEAGCAAPIGATAVISADGTLTVRASVYSADGTGRLDREHSAAVPAAPHSPGEAGAAYYGRNPVLLDTAQRAGLTLAEALLEGGAAALAPLG